MNKKFGKIFMILEQDDYATAQSIAKQLRVTDRTVRNYIKSMQMELPDSIVRIVSKPNLGYKLEIQNQSAFSQWKEMVHMPAHSVPSGAEERVVHLLRLLADKTYHKTE